MITVDGRCHCKRCTDRTGNIYRMVGSCSNCGTQDILILYRAGDKAGRQDCPVCGVWNAVNAHRLATPDEFPEALVGTTEGQSDG